MIRRKPKSRESRQRTFRRVYHSEERVRWTKAQPCAFCGGGPCDNAHITNGGMGRKADYDQIIPACLGSRMGRVGMDDLPGCHWELDHGMGKRAMERKYGVDLKDLAAKHQARWLAYSEGLTE